MNLHNRFAALNERDAEDQLKALYGSKPIRTGATATHVTWFVKSKTARMARASHHRNGAGKPMYIVEVK